MSSAFICPPCPCPYCAPSLLLLVAAVISLPCAQHLHRLRCLVLVLLRLWLLSCLSLSSVLPRLLLKGSTRAACLRLPCVCIASALPEPCLCLALPLPCLCPAFVSQCVSHVIILPLCCRCLSYLAPREATGATEGKGSYESHWDTTGSYARPWKRQRETTLQGINQRTGIKKPRSREPFTLQWIEEGTNESRSQGRKNLMMSVHSHTSHRHPFNHAFRVRGSSHVVERQ